MEMVVCEPKKKENGRILTSKYGTEASRRQLPKKYHSWW